MKLRYLNRNSKKAVAPVIFVVLFVILFSIAFFAYVFGIADKQIIAQDNSYAPGALNTPEFNYMSSTIVLVPAFGLFVCLIYLVVKSQQRNPSEG